MKVQIFLLVLVVLFLTDIATANNLKGSPASMERQNVQADRDGLSRLTEKQLEVFKTHQLLVPLPYNKTVTVDDRLPEKYRWCRPCTRKFFIDFGKDYESKFGKPLQVNSAIRTVEYQKELRSRNGNAASAKIGLRQSAHLTGAAVDIAKKDMSFAELRWMRSRLMVFEKEKFVEATEEFRQPVFHVVVFNKYCTQ